MAKRNRGSLAPDRRLIWAQIIQQLESRMKMTIDLKEIYILGKCGWYMDKNGNDIERCPKCGQVSLKVQNELAGLGII